MFRKSIAHVLIILVICQIGAAWTLFSTAIWIHKQNKQSRLSDKSRWEEFVLTTTEFESNLVEENEIEIEGRLYDIVQTHKWQGKVTVTAVADHAENKMKRTLSGLQNEETGWSEVAKRAQSFSMAYYYPVKTLHIFTTTFSLRAPFFLHPDNNFCEGFPKIQEQPPSL